MMQPHLSTCLPCLPLHCSQKLIHDIPEVKPAQVSSSTRTNEIRPQCSSSPTALSSPLQKKGEG